MGLAITKLHLRALQNCQAVCCLLRLIGLQIAGRPFAEAPVMKVADAYQRETDFPARKPPMVKD